MNTNSKLVPKRRFKEFINADAWEQRKVSELINDIADGPFGSNLKVIHYTDEKEARIIQLSNIGEGGWQDENVRYTTFEHAKEIKRCIVEQGELVMAKMMPAGLTIERPNTDEMYVLSSDAVRIKINETLIDTKYFVYMTKCDFFLNQINNDAQGSTRTRTSISKIRMMDIPVPSLQEQNRIGQYFKHLDNLITLHQRKLEKMKNMKAAYLTEMFPQKGETVPKRRFAGFTDAWEQRKVGELGVVITGSTPATSHDEYYSDDGIPWVTPTDINKNVTVDTPRKLSKEGQKVGRVVPKDTILVTCIASIGKNTMLGTMGSFNQQINGLVPDFNKYNPYFLFSESELWSAKMKKQASAGTMQIVNKTEFSLVETMVPSLPEQQKIGDYFQTLDNLITLHQRKLEKLHNIKKAYLNEMFV